MSALDEIRSRIPDIPEAEMSRAEKDRARLLTAIYAVEALHNPIGSWDERIIGTVCEECSVDGEHLTFHPCPTLEVLTAVLEEQS